MKKSIKVILGIISVLVVGFFIKFIFTNEFKRTITILDCEGVYYKKLVEKSKPGFIDFSETNAKMDIANCLCEKYNKNKSENYKTEVLNIYKMKGWRWEKYETPKVNIDIICKYRKEVFAKSYNL